MSLGTKRGMLFVMAVTLKRHFLLKLYADYPDSFDFSLKEKTYDNVGGNSDLSFSGHVCSKKATWTSGSKANECQLKSHTCANRNFMWIVDLRRRMGEISSVLKAENAQHSTPNTWFIREKT